MIPIIPAIMATKTGLDILLKAKDWFYPNKTLAEAEDILKKRMADDVGSLQEQVRLHRQVIDRLVEQVKADKDMLEKHNEVLIHLSEAAEEVASAQARLRVITYWAIGLAGLSLVSGVLYWVLK
ncbi:MAG: hypothetical protein JWM68_319 [Verrucomicrobiales bacterium]|nr:hypothetical protein [Verrucomicrobiales bacterium]